MREVIRNLVGKLWQFTIVIVDIPFKIFFYFFLLSCGMVFGKSINDSLPNMSDYTRLWSYSVDHSLDSLSR